LFSHQKRKEHQGGDEERLEAKGSATTTATKHHKKEVSRDEIAVEYSSNVSHKTPAHKTKTIKTEIDLGKQQNRSYNILEAV